MKLSDVPRVRTRNLRLEGSSFDTAAEVVAWHGGVQAQDYAPAQWALAQRATGLTPTDIDRALGAGEIIRTHALRETWHFLARDDARWIVGLTGPRLRARSARRFDELGLDARTLGRVERVLSKALQGGNHLTRTELGEALVKGRIDTSGQRLPWITAHLEFEQVVCSGAPRGKSQTYAAFDEMVPAARSIDAADATRELVRRYLQSHGPSEVHDLQWWGSLKIADIRTALDELGDRVESGMVNGVELWWTEVSDVSRSAGNVRLLETWDEYVVGYTRSRFLGDPVAEEAIGAWRRSHHRNVLTKNGFVLGHWRRRRAGKATSIEVRTYEPMSQRDERSLRAEAKRYGAFFGYEAALDVGRVG